MTLLHKLGVATLVLALLGASYWYLLKQLEAKNEAIGALQAEQRQLRQSLADSQEEVRQKTAEMTLWRDLYTDLQQVYQEINTERESQQRQLERLREEQDVQDYVACPMPDSLYNWVREN